MDVAGLTLTDTPIEIGVLRVLREAYLKGFTVKSGFARYNAELIGVAASLQLISTRITRDVYGNEWQITSKGLRWLNEQEQNEQD